LNNEGAKTRRGTLKTKAEIMKVESTEPKKKSIFGFAGLVPGQRGVDEFGTQAGIGLVQAGQSGRQINQAAPSRLFQ
jgi:hypothetical protein